MTTYKTTGCIFEDLGFSSDESKELREKADLMNTIVEKIDKIKLNLLAKGCVIPQDILTSISKGEINKYHAHHLKDILKMIKKVEGIVQDGPFVLPPSEKR